MVSNFPDTTFAQDPTAPWNRKGNVCIGCIYCTDDLGGGMCFCSEHGEVPTDFAECCEDFYLGFVRGNDD